jgi:hypothetical protein
VFGNCGLGKWLRDSTAELGVVDYESLMDFSVYLPCMGLAFECVLSFAWIHDVARGFRSTFHRFGVGGRIGT